MPNKIIITQSNYIPWKGYFTTMKKATHIILYDNAQYTKRDWRNRNKIITPNGPSWLSIPVDVKGKFHQKINEAKVKDNNWSLNHWNKITENYRKAPYFKEYSVYFEELYLKELKNYDYLSDINRVLLQRCISLLELDISILDSREFDIRGGKTEKLINLCNDMDANEYFTGPAAKGYMDEGLFEKNNIKLTYYDLDNFPEYTQMWQGFDHYVSIVDMFFNLGDQTIKYFNWK
tara:strand:- start:54580 stop:55278 length:699 start_codon:yes stop_codon:yes gene_type:complete